MEELVLLARLDHPASARERHVPLAPRRSPQPRPRLPAPAAQVLPLHPPRPGTSGTGTRAARRVVGLRSIPGLFKMQLATDRALIFTSTSSLKSGKTHSVFLNLVCELEGAERLRGSEPLSPPSHPQVPKAAIALTAQPAWCWAVICCHHIRGFQQPCWFPSKIVPMAPRNTHPHVPPTSLLPGTQRDPPRSSLLGAPTCLYGDGTRFPGYPPPPSPSAAGTRSWSR